MAVKAYILISADPAWTKAVVGTLREMPQVIEASEVMGPYDIVVEVEAAGLPDITTMLRDQIRAITGVRSTVTCVAMP